MAPGASSREQDDAARILESRARHRRNVQRRRGARAPHIVEARRAVRANRNAQGRCTRHGCEHGAPNGSLARADFDMAPFAAAPANPCAHPRTHTPANTRPYACSHSPTHPRTYTRSHSNPHAGANA